MKIFTPKLSIKQKWKTIDEQLKLLNKHILITIEDCDRLTKEEILEVFKLIKVTLNSKYFTFILSYDKDYILNTLEDHNYIDKMITAEFRMPKLAEKYEDTSKPVPGILGALTKLFPAQGDNHVPIYSMLGLDGKRHTNQDFTDIFLENISTIRDLKRLINSYILTGRYPLN